MARTVRVGEFQRMMAAERAAEDEAAQTAAIDKLSGQLVAENGKAPGFRSPALTVAEQLQALTLQDDIAGMPLGQVVGLIRLAVAEQHVNATEQEIRAEAERRFRAASEVDPEAPDGDPIWPPRPDESDSVVSTGDESTPSESDSVAPVSDGPTIADHLVGLGVERECTAEMSLHMITERVRDAARERLPLEYAPTESDIVHEAERIWGGFSVNRRGPLEVDVNPDGTVAEVRPAEMTPDRGDVTRHHQVGEDDGRRFSGAGASDKPEPSKLIPTDQQFNGRLYRDAPELANIAERLIGEHGFLEDLINCDIRWYWKRKTGVSKGRVKIGFMKRASDLLGHFSGADFIGWLSATTARDGKFTDRQIEASVFHQLLHVGSDDKGNWIFLPHDFEGFAAEVRAYGTWTEGLKLGGQAFTAAHQMGLFDATDEDDSDEDEEDDEGEEIDDDLMTEPDARARVADGEEPDTSGELPTGEEIDAARAGT